MPTLDLRANFPITGHSRYNKTTVKSASRGKAWVVAVSMGYGHQRTAYPLRDLSPDGKVLNANDYEGIPIKDKEIWADTSYFYEPSRGLRECRS